MRHMILCVVSAVLVAGVGRAGEPETPPQAPPIAAAPAPASQPVVTERDPALGAPLPENVIYETKNGWKFDDDQLVFKNPNRNADGRRYIIWKDYHWVIGAQEITLLDPRPFGVALTASRQQVDKKGRPMPDEKIMDDLKDQAGDIRRSREPAPPPSPVFIGVGWGFGIGHYHGPYYHDHHRYHYERRPAPRYRYR